MMYFVTDSLKDRLTGENASKLMGCLRDFGAAVSKETELKAWGFLATRISLLLRSYPTTAEVQRDFYRKGVKP